jgi:hypothetical protein
VNDTVNTASPSKLKKILLALAGVVVVGIMAGTFYWTYTCPCDRLPGAILMGEKAPGPVTDWSFANDVELCQIQIYAGWRPHAINLNCMATDSGNLYLSCSVCDTKYWASKVAANPNGRLRLNGIVYPITITRVTDPAEMEQAWQARIDKLQVVGNELNPAPPPDAVRNDRWWTFRIQSSS